MVTVVVPTNDECTSAEAIGEGNVAFNTTNATDSATTLPASCNEGSGTAIHNDVWYLYSPSCSGTATVSTCGAALFDTRLAAYFTACPPAGSIVGCNDNGAGCGSGTSTMTFPVAAGAAYYIRLGGVTGGGAGTMNVSCLPQALCPADLNSDGTVDGADLSAVLNYWGTEYGDVDGDGTTNGADLAAVLNSWGVCE